MDMKIFSVIITLVLLLSLFAVLPISAAPTEVWVDDDGPDNGTDHFDTIQEGVNAVEVGGTVHVAAGTYLLSAEIYVDKDISLLGEDESTTILDGQNTVRIMRINTDCNGVIDGFTFQNGSMPSGGGLYIGWGSSSIVSNCTFLNNSADNYGAGIYNHQYASPTITNCTLTNNSSSQYGGGMYNSDNSSPTVMNCTFSGNTATTSGGGIYNSDSSSLSITDCTFSENTASSGGGIYNDYSPSTITNCTFSGNTASGGGGIYNWQSTSIITDCTFSGNTGNNAGGGIYNSASPTITDCTFSGNSSDSGAGMYNYIGSSPTITNCVFSDNTATNNGGGMYNQVDSSSTVTNCTFSGNTATDGGGMFNIQSTPTVTDCILWGNSPEEIYNNSSTPVVTYCDVQGGYTGLGNIDEDPLFEDASSENYMLTGDSPCIDAGIDTSGSAYGNVTDDIDDTLRPQRGSYDIGAYERIYPAPAEVWVDVGGPDNGYDQFDTIQEGIDAVESGGTVHVAAGTYLLSAEIYIDKDISLLGEDESTTILDGQGTVRIMRTSDLDQDNVIDGFTFQNGYASDGAGMYNIAYSSPIVSNCTFLNNSANSYGAGIFNNNYSSPTIANCTFSGNTASISGGGIYNNNASSPAIKNCIFSENTATNYGGGIYNNSSANPTVTNCTFSANTSNIFGGAVYNYYSSPTITNCILWGDSPDEIYNVSSTPVVTYCDVQGGYEGVGNIDLDPEFVDASGGNLRLFSSSPCLDSGTDTSGPAYGGVTDDIESVSRPQGVAYDIGAYEKSFNENTFIFNLSIGWNLVSWHGQNNTPLSEALQGLEAHIDYVYRWNAELGMYEYSHYINEELGWQGNFETLDYEYGYWIHSLADCVWTI